MDAFNQALGDLGDAVNALLARALTIWLPIQVGIMALAMLAAGAIATLFRRRLDLVTMTMGWPPLLRAVVRAITNNLGTIIFAIIIAIVRLPLQRMTDPANSYLLGVAVNLATAWDEIGGVAGAVGRHGAREDHDPLADHRFAAARHRQADRQNARRTSARHRAATPRADSLSCDLQSRQGSGRSATRQEVAHASQRLHNILRRIGVRQPHIALAQNAEIGTADHSDAGVVE